MNYMNLVIPVKIVLVFVFLVFLYMANGWKKLEKKYGENCDEEVFPEVFFALIMLLTIIISA